jgi:hypothetical protein
MMAVVLTAMVFCGTHSTRQSCVCADVPQLIENNLAELMQSYQSQIVTQLLQHKTLINGCIGYSSVFRSVLSASIPDGPRVLGLPRLEF